MAFDWAAWLAQQNPLPTNDPLAGLLTPIDYRTAAQSLAPAPVTTPVITPEAAAAVNELYANGVQGYVPVSFNRSGGFLGSVADALNPRSIFENAAKIPGTPEAVATGVQAGIEGNASWNPYDPQAASVFDIGAGGTSLSQNQDARDIGRTVGTLIGGYYLAPLLAGEAAPAAGTSAWDAATADALATSGNYYVGANAAAIDAANAAAVMANDAGLLTLTDTLPQVPSAVPPIEPTSLLQPTVLPQVADVGLKTLPTIAPSLLSPVDPLPAVTPEVVPVLPQVADVGLKTLPAAITMPTTPAPVDPLPMPDVTPAVVPNIPAVDPILTLPSTLPETPAPVDPLPAPDVTPAVTPTIPNVASVALTPWEEFLSLAKSNPELAKLAFMGLGAAAGGSGGSSGGGGYVDSGYRPNVTRGGFLSTATPTLGTPTSVAPRGLINIPSTAGYANSGLWRYGLLGGK